MQTGKLRHRVTVQSPSNATDPFANPGTWTTVITMWASIDSASPRDVYNAGLQNMRVSHIVTIRYPGASYVIKAGYQIQYKNRTFVLQQGITNPEERNKMLQLLAWEINPPQGGVSE